MTQYAITYFLFQNPQNQCLLNFFCVFFTEIVCQKATPIANIFHLV